MTDENTPAVLKDLFFDLQFTQVEGTNSWVATDADGNVQVSACGRGPVDPDPVRTAQDAMEMRAQVADDHDDWA